MQIGSPDYCVETFPGQPSRLAVGCESGTFSLHDVSTSSEIASYPHEGAIISLRSVDPNTLYGATETHVFFQDTREGRPPKTFLSAPSEIYDLAVRLPLVAIATLSNGIVLSDSRTLIRPHSRFLPAVCTSLAFSDDSHIAAGYIDTAVGVWDVGSRSFSAFSKRPPELITPAVVHAIAARDRLVIAATQTGVAVYRDGGLVAEDKYEHEGPVQVIAFADCFGGKTYAVSGAADGSMMVFNLETLKPVDCMYIEGEKVQGIASNEEFIAVADTSEAGNVAIFTQSDFIGGEEDSG
jgi:WD40 repeat protein